MAQINPNNFASFKNANLVENPTIKVNKDGSHKIYTKIAYSADYMREGKLVERTRVLELTEYVAAGRSVARYENLVKGSPVSGFYEHYTDIYEKDGQTVYAYVNELKSLEFGEGIEAAKARRARNEAAAAAEAAPAPAAAPVTQTSPAAPVDPLA